MSENRQTLLELLEEVASRASDWSTCAVGEKTNGALFPRSELVWRMHYTELQAQEIIELGVDFMRKATELRDLYLEILNIQPNIETPEQLRKDGNAD